MNAEVAELRNDLTEGDCRWLTIISVFFFVVFQGGLFWEDFSVGGKFQVGFSGVGAAEPFINGDVSSSLTSITSLWKEMENATRRPMFNQL